MFLDSQMAQIDLHMNVSVTLFAEMQEMAIISFFAKFKTGRRFVQLTNWRILKPQLKSGQPHLSNGGSRFFEVLIFEEL